MDNQTFLEDNRHISSNPKQGMEGSPHVGEVGVCRNVTEAETGALKGSKPFAYGLETLIWGGVCTWYEFVRNGKVASTIRRRNRRRSLLLLPLSRRMRENDDVYKTPIFRTWHYCMALSLLGQRDQIRPRMQVANGCSAISKTILYPLNSTNTYLSKSIQQWLEDTGTLVSTDPRINHTG